MIQRTTFNHGWWYHYCVHKPKSKYLIDNGLSNLYNYLTSMFNDCPNDFFQHGPRSSRLKFELPNLNIKTINDHVICDLTKNALQTNANRFKSNHMKVQMFMLEFDKKTIAIEVPVWLSPGEHELFNKFFESDKPLTGHIDLLRIDNGKIWVWDYKPGAAKEKYAATQTFFYANMLSVRTQIPIENFMCGWFDSQNCYTFKPVLNNINSF